MPTTNSTPADGTQTTAAAQVLNRRIFILRDRDDYDFAPTVATQSGLSLREYAAIPAYNLPNITVSLFLFPEYEGNETTYSARTDIEWRVVFQMPPAVLPDSTIDPTIDGVVSEDWIPLNAPMIIPVGVPIEKKFCCHNAQYVSIEIRFGQSTDESDQGVDRLVVSIGASA